LRDLPNPTASLQARYQNFRRFDQPDASPDSPKASFSAQRLPEQEDPFDADWEPAFYTRRSQSTDPEHGHISGDPGWQLGGGCGGGGGVRPGTEPPRQWNSALTWRDPPPPPLPARNSLNIEEAFPPARPVKNSRPSSSKGSSDSIFNNPFTDNFVINSGSAGRGRTMSTTPPVFEGEVHSDRMSNASDLSFQSGEGFLNESQDVFEKQSVLSSGFKVQAKTMKLPKSESIDIFSVSADPFDDDFFK